MLRPEEVFGNTYKVVREIGRGGAGVVYLAFHTRLQKYVVLKRIKTGIMDMQTLRTETDVLKNLHHPNLPQIYDFLCTEGEVYTVMDYVEGSDFEHLSHGPSVISEKQAFQWFRQLVEVLDYLHSQPKPILHSDIKPANIIMRPNGQLCLIDFNISLNDSERGKVMGYSPNFASPEQVYMAESLIHGKTVNYSLDGRSDIYSAASTMYYMITGKYPDSTVKNPLLSQCPWINYSKSFLDILDRCMEPEREKRYRSASKLLNVLDNIKKQDIRYKRFLGLNAVSYIGSALLIGTGLFFLINGIRRSNLSNYQQDYSVLCDAIDNDDRLSILDKGFYILNEKDYKRILNENPGEKADILYSVGRVYYYDKNYESAEYYLTEAINTTDSLKLEYLLMRASTEYALGNDSEADTDMLKAESITTEDKIVDVASTYYSAGKYEDTKRLLENRYSSGRSDCKEELYLALSYWRIGESEESVRLCQSVIRKYNDLSPIEKETINESEKDALYKLSEILGE